jgi:hypothetical protein
VMQPSAPLNSHHPPGSVQVMPPSLLVVYSVMVPLLLSSLHSHESEF